MPDQHEIERWVETLKSRYVSYLTTSFYFRDPDLRESFRDALKGEDLLKGHFPERGRHFPAGIHARELAQEAFPGAAESLFPALINAPLHAHQERAIRAAHFEDQNVVVASGTASGKTECFLYPVLFSLYQEHLAGSLDRPGVRAMVLYPMNALVNDQRERLGALCRQLEDGGSHFGFRFGQYIGQTPYNAGDTYRNGAERRRNRLPGELVFRDEMRDTPPHILFTNYSMLEYLLIRPDDSPLFDDGRGAHWRFLILDEAHAYRGAKGIEMAMLLRRLKERVRDGGRRDPFRCIATSATIASGHTQDDQYTVADFASALFGEPYSDTGVVFGRHQESPSEAECGSDIRRYHIFVRALEGAFLLHDQGRDRVVLNRVSGNTADDPPSVPLEIAICRECGQHYYVGKEVGGRLGEAVRDPSRSDFGVDYYLPSRAADARDVLCRRCGAIARGTLPCGCDAPLPVQRCENRADHPDQLKECAQCGYTRGGVGDPVQEIVHGADGPGAVLATAVHSLLAPEARKILAFADSRQDAAFFAWYAEDSYTTVRDRNLMLRALRMNRYPSSAGRSPLSVEDLGQRLMRVRQECSVNPASDTMETQMRRSYRAILAEILSEDVRLSLSGVGLARWCVQLPAGLTLPDAMSHPRWDLAPAEAADLFQHLLSLFWAIGAIGIPGGPEFPNWKDVSRRPRQGFARGAPRGRKNIREWGGPQSAIVKHFLPRLLDDSASAWGEDRKHEAQSLMKAVWDALMEHQEHSPRDGRLLERAGPGGAFRIKGEWLRIQTVEPSELRECRVCARVTSLNIRGLCTRNRCPGTLIPADIERLRENHYRSLYEMADLPPSLTAAEHTAQLADDEARQRQAEFKAGRVHLLSSSTTFEVGVDLGDLEVTFLRNVPPEPFNYAQRVGRAGRRSRSGLALTYCRRSPHDLHYFSNPKDLIAGSVAPPRLVITNPKIVTRHMTAVALSEFFRDSIGAARSGSVQDFIGGDWDSPSVAESFKRYCEGNRQLAETLLRIVPSGLHETVGFVDGGWVDQIGGVESRVAKATAEVCTEYLTMKRLRDRCVENEEYWRAGRVRDRMRTISGERAVSFLARRAVIPKYGFPVDVVELHTGATKEGESVELARDLSLAIAEYAPGSSVVANKLEWKSCGVRTVFGQQPRVRLYDYGDSTGFRSAPDVQGGIPLGPFRHKYLVPEFGFVTPLWDKPRPPERRSERMFSTRPFFRGFRDPGLSPAEMEFWGVWVTEAIPGELVVLCEGRRKEGFLLCDVCGVHVKEPPREHRAPEGEKCTGIFRRFSLGHELTTDVVKARFPEPLGHWDLYSVGYALLLGAADAVAVPERDLNVTLAPEAVVLYDDVPGGAGLVAQLTTKASFRRVLERSRERVAGGCGCDRSCYGCLRSYRNQFAHIHLDRLVALRVIEAALAKD